MDPRLFACSVRREDKKLARNCCLLDVGQFIQAGGVARRAMFPAHLPAGRASGCRIPDRRAPKAGVDGIHRLGYRLAAGQPLVGVEEMQLPMGVRHQLL